MLSTADLLHVHGNWRSQCGHLCFPVVTTGDGEFGDIEAFGACQFCWEQWPYKKQHVWHWHAWMDGRVLGPGMRGLFEVPEEPCRKVNSEAGGAD